MEGNTARGASSPAKPAWDDVEEVFIYAVSFSPGKKRNAKNKLKRPAAVVNLSGFSARAFFGGTRTSGGWLRWDLARARRVTRPGDRPGAPATIGGRSIRRGAIGTAPSSESRSGVAIGPRGGLRAE